MTEQETIERYAVIFKRAAFDRLISDDGCPEGEQIKAGIAAVFAALRPGDALPGGMVVEPEWQTMESAPKDGTRFLATGGGAGEVTICQYGARTGCWLTSEATLDDRDDEPEGYSRPTHWKPLPAAPKGGEA